jgi:putative methanogenesis marker protein 3
MVRVTLDGTAIQADDGACLRDILFDHNHALSLAIIRPGVVSEEATRHFRITTTKGEFVAEIPDGSVSLPDPHDASFNPALHWSDRYAAAFGPFPSDFNPSRRPSRYARGDILIGCGGYDTQRSYLIVSRKEHQADHGAAEGGGIIGRVVAGRGAVDRLDTGDRITGIERIISWADSTHTITTTDLSLPLEEGMEIISHIRIHADGYSEEDIDTTIADSVDHLLFSLQSGIFHAERTTSTHCMDAHLGRMDIRHEQKAPRREGAVTARTKGKLSGAIYIYRDDVATSPHHTVIGQVTHGIELIRLISEGESCAVLCEPERFDLLGMHLGEALSYAEKRGISLNADSENTTRVIISQEPGTTLQVLKEKQVTVTTMDQNDIIDITLFDEKAPRTVDIFRRFTGLKRYSIGMLPFFFSFDDVWLFEPDIPEKINIIPENTPVGSVPKRSLGMTNASRRGAGLVGVRDSENAGFGPTAEPFEGTNIIGIMHDVEKLGKLKEGEPVYIREVKR